MADDRLPTFEELEARERGASGLPTFEDLNAKFPEVQEAPGPTFGEAVRGALGRSLPGQLGRMTAKTVLPGMFDVQAMEREAAMEPKSALGRTATSALTLAVDAPAYVLGGEVAAAGMPSVAAAAAGKSMLRRIAARSLLSGSAFAGVGGTKEVLSQVEQGQPDEAALATRLGREFVAGASLGPAGEIARPLLRLPVEAGSLTVAGAAVEGRLPTAGEFAENAALIAAMHGTTKGLGAAEGAVRTARANRERQAAQTFQDRADMLYRSRPGFPGVLEDTVEGAPGPSKAQQRAELLQEAAALKVQAMEPDTPPHIMAEIQRRLGDIYAELHGETPAPSGFAPEVTQDITDRLYGALTRPPRQGQPPGGPGVAGPIETPPPPGLPTQERRPNRMRRQLEEQGIDTRGMSPQQMADALAENAPFTYEEMPDFIPRESRPEVRRVLAEGGIRGKARKELMAGPEKWKQAAWAYYQATGELPPGTTSRREPGGGTPDAQEVPALREEAQPPADTSDGLDYSREDLGIFKSPEEAEALTGMPAERPGRTTGKEAQPPADTSDGLDYSREDLGIFKSPEEAQVLTGMTSRPRAGVEAQPPADTLDYSDQNLGVYESPEQAEQLAGPRPDARRWSSETQGHPEPIATIPGEPFDTLDENAETGRFTAAIVEGEDAKGTYFVAKDPRGEEIGPKRATADQARLDAESWAAERPTEKAEAPERPSPIEPKAGGREAEAPKPEGKRWKLGSKDILDPEYRDVNKVDAPEFTHTGFPDDLAGARRAASEFESEYPGWVTDIKGYTEHHGPGKSIKVWQIRAKPKEGAPAPPEPPKPTPRFAEGDQVELNGTAYVVKKAQVLPVVEKGRPAGTRIIYDLQNEKGDLLLGEDERNLRTAHPRNRIPEPPPPKEPDILAGDANRIFTKDRYEAAKEKFRRLAKGKDLGSNAFADPELLGAILDIGGFHVERLARQGVKTLKESWMRAIRDDVEGAGGKISGRALEWLWANPDMQDLVEKVEKEVGHAKPEGSAVRPGPEAGPAPARGSRQAPERPARPEGQPEVSARPEPRPKVGGGRDAGEQHRPRGGPGERGAGEVSGNREEPTVPRAVPRARSGDWSYPEDFTTDQSRGERLKTNQAARDLLDKKPSELTEDDLETLAKFSGRGGLAERPEGEYERGELFEHYTSLPVARFLWKAVERMGKTVRQALEPSVGSGVFIGTKPQGVKFTGVELDETAAKVAELLYPNQTIHTMPFEKYVGAEGTFDLVIGNPPFEETRNALRYAPESKKYSDIKTLHDFFIAKSIDQLKPGGVGAFVVSTGFLDKLDPTVRKAIYEKADLVAAFRLPSGVMAKNTQWGGTPDVVFFRRRAAGEKPKGDLWTRTDQFKDSNNVTGNLNAYYIEHPEAMLGVPEWGHAAKFQSRLGVRGKFDESVVKKALSSIKELAEPARTETPEEPSGRRPWEGEAPKQRGDQLPPRVRIGQHYLKGDKIMVATPQGGYPAVIPPRTVNPVKVRMAVTLLNGLEAVQEAIAKNESAAKIKTAQTALRVALDKYQRLYGTDANGKPTRPSSDVRLMKFMSGDPRRSGLRQLVNPDGTYAAIVTHDMTPSRKYARKAVDFTDFYKTARHLEQTEGVILPDSLVQTYKGEGIKTREDAVKRLEADPRMNRTRIGWLTDEEYLYGPVRDRMAEAKALGLDKQVEKLRNVLPEQAIPSLFKVKPNEGWLPERLVEDFVRSFGEPVFGKKIRSAWQVFRDYQIDWQGRVKTERPSMPWDLEQMEPNPARGRKAWNFETILTHALNGTKFTARASYVNSEGDVVEGYSPEETAALNRAIDKVQDKFLKYITDSKQLDPLIDEYNSRFRGWRAKSFEPTFEVDGFVTDRFSKIHPWQAQAANFQLAQSKGLNALGVGLGKTLTQIITAAKGIQEGKWKTAIVVTPGNVRLKWLDDFRSAFPGLRILDLGNLGAGLKRGDLLSSLALNDWDVAIVSREGFGSISVTPEKQAAFYQGLIDELRRELTKVPEKIGKEQGKKRGRSDRDIQVLIDSYEAKIAKILEASKEGKGKEQYFEHLKVDALFVDEAHEYRNFPFASPGIVGRLNLAGKDVQRALDMMLKARVVQENAGGRNVFFATATPTPNTPLELYTMLKMVSPETLDRYGIESPNDFLNTFAKTAEVKTIDPAGGVKYQLRVVGWQRMNDLRTLRDGLVFFRETADVRAEHPDYPFPEPGRDVETVTLEPSPLANELFGEIREKFFHRPSDYDPGDWNLIIIDLAKKAAQHPGLYDSKYIDYRHPNNKLDAIASRVASEYNNLKKNPIPVPEGAEEDYVPHNGHLIFLDLHGETSQKNRLPKSLYALLKERLVEAGIPANEIEYISGSRNNSPEKKQEISRRYNSGELRVLIGSTPTIGVGMDLQKITTHIYHWDPQWNPGMMEQRDGRGARQGNLIDSVKIVRFVQRGSFDAKYYSLLRDKQKWMQKLWRGEEEEVSNFGETGEESWGFEEIAAVLAPTPGDRAMWDANAAHENAKIEAVRKAQEAERAAEALARVEDEIKDREGKLEHLLGKSAASEKVGAYASVIQGHEEALVNLRVTQERLAKEAASEAQWSQDANARLEDAKRRFDRTTQELKEARGSEIGWEGVRLRNAITELGGTFPKNFKGKEYAASLYAQMMELKERQPDAEALRTAFEEGDVHTILPAFENPADDSPRYQAIRRAWQTLYGEIPKIRVTRGGTGAEGPRSVGAASGSAMLKAQLAERRRLVKQAQEMGLARVGEPIPTLSEVERQSLLRQAQALKNAGDEAGAAATLKKLEGQPVKKRSKLRDTAVPVPEAGLPLAEVERKILERYGPVDEAKAIHLGKDSIGEAEFAGLNRGEKVIHLSRRIMAARDQIHIQRILGAEKYRLWTLPKEDQAAVAAQVGRRMAEAGLDEYPARLRAAIEAVEKGQRPGIATGALARGETRRWVFTLLPSRIALRGTGILEAVRPAYEVVKREWNLWMAYGETTLFRDPQGKHVKLNSKDDEIIYQLLDNPEGHEAYLDRPEVKLDTGEKVTPQGWHRAVAKELKKIVDEFADRQGLASERRRKFYATHILDRILAMEPATKKDLGLIHALAKGLLEKEYDAVKVAEKLPKDLKRSKALQIIDLLKSKRPPTTLKSFNRRVDIILGADDTAGIPRELWQPYLKQRLGGTPWKKSALGMYEAYLRYAIRKVHLEPAILSVRDRIEAMPGKGEKIAPFGVGAVTRREYAESMIDRVLGRPTLMDKGTDALLESIAGTGVGQLAMRTPVLWRLFKPGLATRFSTSLTKIQYLRLLGLAFDSALTNVTQGVNTLAEYGLRDTFKGYLKLSDPRFAKTLYHEHLLREFEGFFAGPQPFYTKALNVVERAILSPFTFAEFVNRGAAFAAGLQRAKRLGLSFDKAVQLGNAATSAYLAKAKLENRGATGLAWKMFGKPTAKDIFYTSEAAQFARAGVIKTQFGYSPVESPPAVGTPGGRLLLQFMSYPTQQAAFLADGLIQARKNRELMGFMRYLALLGGIGMGFNALAKLVGWDLQNQFSIRGIMPGWPAPNVKLAFDLYNAMRGRPDAQRELARDVEFRWPVKAAKYGPSAFFPGRPVEVPKPKPYQKYAAERLRSRF